MDEITKAIEALKEAQRALEAVIEAANERDIDLLRHEQAIEEIDTALDKANSAAARLGGNLKEVRE